MDDFKDDAATALRTVREAREKTAARATAPAWYHPALGGIFALIVASMEAPNFSGGLTALGLCGMAILVTQYQKHTGLWMNGLSSGGKRSRRLMAFGLLVMVVGVIAGVRLKFGYGVDGALIVTGIVLGLFATWLGYAWERAFSRDAGAEQ